MHDFDVWPKNAKGKIPQSEEALSCDKLAYFAAKSLFDRPVLTSDYESDVPVGAEKDNLWDCNRCAYPC